MFRTRHAKESDWVRWEYETYDSQFPDRPLVPVLGDTTDLLENLKARQHSDFCPLINELLTLVRDLEDKGVSKRDTRAVVLKRLEEEGIKLPPDKRRQLFGMLGVLGLATAPFHLLSLGNDFVAD